MKRQQAIALQVINEAILEDEDLYLAPTWKSDRYLFQVTTAEAEDRCDYRKLERKYRIVGEKSDPRSIPELQGMPILEGFVGPMFGGREGGLFVVRYEAQSIHDLLSR